MKIIPCIFSITALLFLLTLNGGCNTDMKEKRTDGHDLVQPDIDSVIARHTDELMAIKGVAGLFADKADEKKPCIHVMVIKKTAELERKIPSEIEGYQVVIEETGEIRPLE